MYYEIGYASERGNNIYIKVATLDGKPTKKQFVVKSKEIFKQHSDVRWTYLEQYDDYGNSLTVACFRSPRGNWEPFVDKIWDKTHKI